MKYMSFNSSCAYAAVANMLEQYGFNTEDRMIALEMGLPYLFSCEDGVYFAGPMLQTAEWFNLYLNPRGFRMSEVVIDRGEICAFLQDVKCAMIGIEVSEGNKHAVVFSGAEGERYRFINNKWEQADEPDTLLLSEGELLGRPDETVAAATLQKTEASDVDMKRHLEKSAEVLTRMKRDLDSFCSTVRQP